MKKAIIAIAIVLAITAVSLVLIFVFGFTNCGKSDESISGDDSVLTEEQWKQAIADTAASKTATCETNYNFVFTTTQGDGSENRAEERSKIIYKMDFYNYAFYEKYESSSIATGENQETETQETYMVLDETKIITYDYLKDNKTQKYEWTASIKEKASQEAAQAELMKLEPFDFIFDELTEYSIEELSEMFSSFSYDESSHVYSKKITQDNYTYNYQIAFKQGKIYKIEKTSSEESERGTQNITVKIKLNYEAPNIEVPQAAKDALAEVQQ